MSTPEMRFSNPRGDVQPDVTTVPRLLFIVTVPLTLRFLRGQLAWTRRRGYRIGLVASPGAGLTQAASIEGVDAYPVAIAREIRLIKDIRSLARLTWLLVRLRPDITHVSNPKAGLLGGVASWLTRVRCRLYTLRGLRLETATGLQRAILWCAEWVACRTAHRVVAVSPSLRQRALDLHLVPEAKIVVVGRGSSNGVRVADYAPTADRLREAQALRARLGVPHSAPVIGFVGRLIRDKGVEELLQAFSAVHAEFCNAHLMLVGDTEAAHGLSLRTFDLMQRTPNVVRTGRIAEPAAAYHAMDMLVLPTHREGFPNVALEAAAAGKPVITTTATGAVDAVLDGTTGILVSTGDTAGLASAMMRLLADPEQAAVMGRAGVLWVERYFKPEDVWTGLINVYSDLLAQRS